MVDIGHNLVACFRLEKAKLGKKERKKERKKNTTMSTVFDFSPFRYKDKLIPYGMSQLAIGKPR